MLNEVLSILSIFVKHTSPTHCNLGLLLKLLAVKMEPDAALYVQRQHS